MAILDQGSEERQIALGRILELVADLGTDSIIKLADALDARLNPPEQPQLKLVQSFVAHKNQDKTPAAGIATARNRDGVPA